MHVTSPEDRAIAWRTTDAHRGDERRALLHVLAEGMLVELRSNLDLYGDYQDDFVASLDLLDHYELLFDHSMLMAFQALGVDEAQDEKVESSRRLLASVSARLTDMAAKEQTAADDRERASALADLWRDKLLHAEEEAYLTVAQVAARYGVTPQAVYKWVHSGKISADERPGGSFRIPAAQFRASRDDQARHAEMRRKLRGLSDGHTPLTEEEIVDTLRGARRAEDSQPDHLGPDPGAQRPDEAHAASWPQSQDRSPGSAVQP